MTPDASLKATITPKTKTEIQEAAQLLANLLKQSETYQDLLKMGSLVKQDPDANRILNEIRQKQYGFTLNGDENSIEQLETQLMALPSYKAYIQAETAAREMFQQINAIISKESRVNFAENAKRQGCGCGG